MASKDSAVRHSTAVSILTSSTLYATALGHTGWLCARATRHTVHHAAASLAVRHGNNRPSTTCYARSTSLVHSVMVCPCQHPTPDEGEARWPLPKPLITCYTRRCTRRQCPASWPWPPPSRA